MQHLLIDTTKVQAKWRRLPVEGWRISLYGSEKSLRRVLPQLGAECGLCATGKPLRRIAAEAEAVLSATPAARVVLVSPRKKLKRLAKRFQAAYPQASVRYAAKFGKKLARRLQRSESDNAPHKQPETANAKLPLPAAPQMPAVFTPPPPPAVRAAAPKQPEKTAEPVFTLLADCDLPPVNEAEVLALLKKNRPKKKAALMQLLTAKLHSPATAALVLTRLLRSGRIRIDAAENVRYR
ncbi:hypothetical protein OP500_03520 [Kingella sp. SNUBH-2017]|uniref:hypothetical protein n=1 Tax=Kingella sp. SNUBH-2017 TaxID=2994077 RepID=UPI002363DD94|nr:hypothetical protein [Kingella sp. SNUBH-2017]MDD2182392.1 hypothetical protein [Kingella sp. SNUBH-2017]